MASGQGNSDQWNGQSWVQVDSTPQDEPYATFACVGANFCLSIGLNVQFSNWDGSTWGLGSTTIQVPTNTSAVGLESVSCPTISLCVAIGQDTSATTDLVAPLVDLYGSPPAASCSSLLVVGVRGSGEPGPGGNKATKSNPWYGGFGKTIQDVVNRIAAAVPSAGIQSLSYPAIPVNFNPRDFSKYSLAYLLSVNAGDNGLTSTISDVLSNCHNTRFLLAGYSQGAQVVAESYPLMSQADQSAVVGVVLIGDPYFNGSQANVDVGDYDSTLNGVLTSFPGGSPRIMSGNLALKTASFCHSGDYVCNFSPANAAKCVHACPHSRYSKNRLPDGSTYTTTASQFLLERYLNLPLNPLTITTKDLATVQVKQTAVYRVQLGALGGVAPYKWELQSGSLPVGLLVTHQGVLKGRPLVLDLPGVYTFSVTAFDTAGHRATALLHLTLLPRA